MRLVRLLFILLLVALSAVMASAENEPLVSAKDQALISAVVADFHLDTAATAIDILRNPIPVEYFTSHRTIRFESYNREPRGLVSMTAFVSGPAGEPIPYSIQLRIRTYAYARVAKQPLRQHDPVNDAQLEVRRIETTLLADPVWTGDAAGCRFSRSVIPGTPITARMIEPIPVIDAGAPVTINVETSSIKITTLGTALDAGRLGDRIRVRNQSSGKICLAAVRAPHDVLITQ